MATTPDDERVLNVFRERFPYDQTLTTEEVAEELSVHQRTAQNYVNDLHEKNRLVLDSEGKPNHWRLAETEPVEPVYSAPLANAKRRGKQAAKVGRLLFLVAVSTLAAAGLVTSNHIYANAVGVYLPLFDTGAASTAVITGVLGSVLFGVAAVALLVSVTLPRVAEWYLDDPLTDTV